MKRSRLNEIADSIGIDHKKYKTKATIIDAIKKHKLLEDCENDKDPVTLESIQNIPFERLFIWRQNDKTWGADLVSLKNMIDSGNTRLPWSIDTHTGIQAANDPDEYNDKFEFPDQMKRDVMNRYGTSNFQEEKDTVPERTKLRFFIENLGHDMYITHVIDHIESLHYTKLIYFLRYCCGRCWNYIVSNIDDDLPGNVQSLSILDFFMNWLNIYKRRRDFLAGGKNAGLTMTVKLFRTLQDNLTHEKFQTLVKLLLIEMQTTLAE